MSRLPQGGLSGSYLDKLSGFQCIVTVWPGVVSHQGDVWDSYPDKLSGITGNYSDKVSSLPLYSFESLGLFSETR